MQRVFIHVASDFSRSPQLVEVPGDRPIQTWLGDLLKMLIGLTDADAAEWALQSEDHQLIDPGATLASLNIANGTPFSLCQRSGSGKRKVAAAAVLDLEIESPMESAEASQPGLLARKIPVEAPSLVSSKGTVFVLGPSPVSIGRRGKKNPDIDLTGLDTELISSQEHAEVWIEKKTFMLVVKDTVNGTYLNGVELVPDGKYPLQEGDAIDFGYEGVKLIFRLPPGFTEKK